MSAAKRFKRLFDGARTSPIYWMEGILICFLERRHKYKERLKRATSIDKRRNLSIKLRSLNECIFDVRREQSNYENRNKCKPPSK